MRQRQAGDNTAVSVLALMDNTAMWKRVESANIWRKHFSWLRAKKWFSSFSWNQTHCYWYLVAIKNLLLTVFPMIYVLRRFNSGAASVLLARPCSDLILPWGPRRANDLDKIQNVGSLSAHPTFEHQQRVFCILIWFSACFKLMSVA